MGRDHIRSRRKAMALTYYKNWLTDDVLCEWEVSFEHGYVLICDTHNDRKQPHRMTYDQFNALYHEVVDDDRKWTKRREKREQQYEEWCAEQRILNEICRGPQ